MYFLQTSSLLAISLALTFGCGPSDAGGEVEKKAATSATKTITSGHDGLPSDQVVSPSVAAAPDYGIPTDLTASGGTQDEQIIDSFHRLFYDSRDSTWKDTYWMGTGILKNPLDLWSYQEIIHEIKPDYIIEAGTASGGSALFMANLLDLMGTGQVITIDIEAPNQLSGIFSSNKAGSEVRPSHPRIHYLVGSSTDPQIYAQVESMIPKGARVMVVLDSDHSRDHVLNEMNLYAGMVSTGSYLIVEDSNINGHPVLQNCYPGPMEAIQEFLSTRDDFVVDKDREKFLITFNPSGFLRRTR